MSYKNDQLVLAAQHVAAGKLIVAGQRARIARLKAVGHSTLDHEHTLTVFLDTLAIFEDHERELRRCVDREHRLEQSRRQPP